MLAKARRNDKIYVHFCSATSESSLQTHKRFLNACVWSTGSAVNEMQLFKIVSVLQVLVGQRKQTHQESFMTSAGFTGKQDRGPCRALMF